MKSFLKSNFLPEATLQRQGSEEELFYNEQNSENFAFSAPQDHPSHHHQGEKSLNRQQRRQQAQSSRKQKIKI